MSKLSRHSLVSTAAGAAIAPAIPIGAKASQVQSDTELLQLGVRLLRAKRDFEAALAQEKDDPDDDVNAAMYQLGRLFKPIFASTASTKEGLAVQAAAAATACSELWDKDDGYDSDPTTWEVERVFIEAVCRHTGVAHPAVTRHDPIQ
jgi:membrane peptidoglycan carboxypeptidase